MGKVGSIFRDARLGRGLTLDQVADETNISKRFLQGIESDNYDGFPGEVYALGFLRNYAEFLGLDAKKVIETYHRPDAIEQPPAPAAEPTSAPEAAALSAAESTNSSPAVPQAAEAESAQPERATAPEIDEGARTPSLFSEEDELAQAAEHAPAPKKRTPRKARKPEEASKPAMQPSSGDEKGRQEAEETAPAAPARAEDSAPAPTPEKKARVRKERQAHVQLGRFIPLALVAIVIVIAAVSMLPLLKNRAKSGRTPAEYRAEGLPFEQRLYPQDKVFLPLGSDFVALTLSSITDRVTFNTPYGPLSAGLNEDVVINPSSESERLVATILDFASNDAQSGARVRFDAKEALSSADQPGDITVAADSPKSPGALSAPDSTVPAKESPELLFRSSGGPHPFYVNVNFMAPVLFRYEADKKEWIEKYYRKGESITVNASNSITFWTANAQAVKVNVYQSAGKSTELVMGGAGEIAVKRLSWSSAQGGWAIVANSLD